MVLHTAQIAQLLSSIERKVYTSTDPTPQLFQMGAATETAPMAPVLLEQGSSSVVGGVFRIRLDASDEDEDEVPEKVSSLFS